MICHRCKKNASYSNMAEGTDADGLPLTVMVQLCQPCRTQALRECAHARIHRGAGAVVGPAPW